MGAWCGWDWAQPRYHCSVLRPSGLCDFQRANSDTRRTSCSVSCRRRRHLAGRESNVGQSLALANRNATAGWRRATPPQIPPCGRNDIPASSPSWCEAPKVMWTSERESPERAAALSGGGVRGGTPSTPKKFHGWAEGTIALIRRPRATSPWVTHTTNCYLPRLTRPSQPGNVRSSSGGGTSPTLRPTRRTRRRSTQC